MHRRQFITGAAALATYAQIKDAEALPRVLLLSGRGAVFNPFIYDDDMGTDPDGLTDLGVCIALHKAGAGTLIGVMADSANDYSAPCQKAVLTVNGVLGIPIGAYKGASVPGTSPYAQQVAARFGSASDTRANYPDAVTLYRQLLAASANNSVTIITGGFLVNVAALLASSADGISPLTGVQLVAQKVKKLVIVAGDYPSSSSPEYNIANDIADAIYVFANCPSTVPIVTLGFTLGNNYTVAAPASLSNPLVSPLAYGFNLAGFTSRPAWTSTGIYYAVNGSIANYKQNIFLDGVNGTNTIDAGTGNNTWTSMAGNVSYVKLTNLIRMGQQIGGSLGSWTLRQSTVVQNAAAGPRGDVVATKLNETSANTFFDCFATVPMSAGVVNVSFSLKQAEETWGRVEGASQGTYFDLANGVLGTVTAGGNTAAIVADTNGFYRCYNAITLGSPANATAGVAIANANGNGSYLGVAGHGIYATDAMITTGATNLPYVQDISTTLAQLLANIL